MSVITTVVIVFAVLAAVVVAIASASIRILREYERAVVFRLGRLLGEKGPGLVLLIPAIDRMVRVDLRTVTLDIPPQNVITRDNVPAKVNAVCYFRVVDAARAVVDVEKLPPRHVADRTDDPALRAGQGGARHLLCEREQLNEALQQIVDDHTDPWGIKVTTVEIKDVEIPTAMQRAMALQAEAERERRAKVIHAEGEFQASQRLRDAADVISGNPASLQLRYLQTLTEIGVDEQLDHRLPAAAGPRSRRSPTPSPRRAMPRRPPRTARVSGTARDPSCRTARRRPRACTEATVR